MRLTGSDHDMQIPAPRSIGERTGLLLVIVLVPSILVIDVVVGRQFSLHLFYVVPIALAAWNLKARTGYAIAVFAGTSCAFVAIASRGRGDRIDAIALDILVTYGLYLFVAHILARHRGFIDGARAFARLDAETQALSRREFDRLLESELRRSRRYRRPLSIVLFELAPQRPEARGHLSAAVQAVIPLVRECDSVSRVARRRFALLLVECKPPEPLLVAERLRDTLVANLPIREQDMTIALATYAGDASVTPAGAFEELESLLSQSRSRPGIAEMRLD